MQLGLTLLRSSAQVQTRADPSNLFHLSPSKSAKRMVKFNKLHEALNPGSFAAQLRQMKTFAELNFHGRLFAAFARDVVRGCPPEWVRGLYDCAALPDLTFFFKADLEVSLQRILDGRPQLKYFEAGMDLRLSTDPYESFRIFQGGMLEQ